MYFITKTRDLHPKKSGLNVSHQVDFANQRSKGWNSTGNEPSTAEAGRCHGSGVEGGDSTSQETKWGGDRAGKSGWRKNGGCPPTITGIFHGIFHGI